MDDVDGFHREFKLSITRALADQLAEALEAVARAPLKPEFISIVRPRAGVYQLYLDNEFVYVGKADRDLAGRLNNHYQKLRGRQNIRLADMRFSCLYVDEDFQAVAPEKLLIHHYRGRGAIPWNNNGFGNKDPGRNRDGTRIRAGHFDLTYPLNLEFPVDGLPTGTVSLLALMNATKLALPFNFRFDDMRIELSQIQVTAPPDGSSAGSIFEVIARALPAHWQVVALPGYVISYADAGRRYPSAQRVYHADGSWEDAVVEVDSSTRPDGDPQDETVEQ